MQKSFHRVHWVWLVVLCVLAAGRLHADEIRPAYLQLTEVDTDVYQVLWKVPARTGNQRLSLAVEFDPQIKALSERQGGFIGDAHLQNWSVQAAGGLPGKSIAINGQRESAVEVLLRVEYLEGDSLIHRLTPAAPRYDIPERLGTLGVMSTYLILGVEHILIGIDHLLFVLVLLMLVHTVRKLVWTITAFTLAHSITLSLAALDVIHIPVPPVEACIALSIVFVATEIIRSQQGQPGLAQRRPWLVAFTFGLLHGLGFAAALGEIGLPQTAVPAALLFFNIGVELGQLLFVAAILITLFLFRRSNLPVPAIARQIPVYLIGSVAAFWTIERTVSFWS